MGKINYVIGDATAPKTEGKKIIVHICNDIGAWGAGFVMAISKKWKTPEQLYRAMSKENRVLGNIQFVRVEDDTWVVNMIAQHDTKPGFNGPVALPPIRYEAVRTCLQQVNKYALENNATLHMPRIGCGLAGGKWSEIEAILNDVVSVDTYVYDMPGKDFTGMPVISCKV